jgi:zeta-carotene desaturase
MPPLRAHRPAAPPAAARAAAPARANPAAVRDVGLKDAPLKSLFPDEPAPPVPGAPRLRVAIVGGGLAGLSAAVELLDQGHEVDIYESRPWVGGKVASFQDKVSVVFGVGVVS